MALIKRKESDFILLRKRKYFILSMWSPVHCSLANPCYDLVPSTASPSLISPAGTELCLLELCFRHYLWTRLAFLNISNHLQTGIFLNKITSKMLKQYQIAITILNAYTQRLYLISLGNRINGSLTLQQL